MDNMKLKSHMSGKVQELQQPVDVVEVAPMIPVNSGYLALNNNALEIIKENLKNQPLSYDLFDVVKSPSGGATVFEVPGLAGAEAEKELVGIILDYSMPRAYWDTPDPVEGTPPVCMSRDSLISQDGKICSRCPFDDFGSKDGESNAKACKESVLLFLLRPNSIMTLFVLGVKLSARDTPPPDEVSSDCNAPSPEGKSFGCGLPLPVGGSSSGVESSPSSSYLRLTHKPYIDPPSIETGNLNRTRLT